ncbi:unnamed protein product [Moneuplotes crassus]|uniref:Uncharacterized protein n=1 Tax=Euplotes crassus TaxID=5936 RepID=A0AAD1UR03_EUPCR|nr:unnamed protein product [Moneuplotes crassus]
MSTLTKDQYVSKLKKLNEKLRNKLKDLNGRLERVLDRINTKQLLAKKKHKEVPVEKQISVCDKEIENAQKQLESYKKEILRLTAKVEQLSEVNKVIDLEDEIKAKTEIKANLKKEIKQLERNIHDQGKELEKLANTDDHHTQLNALTEKLRVWKEKNTKLETNIEREKKAFKDQSEKVDKLKTEKTKLEEEVKQLMSEKGWKEPDSEANNQSKMEEIKKMKEEQERMLKKNKNRKEEREMDKKLEKLEKELEDLQKQLREKEQENRISTMKIKQYQRTIKQAKLKPVKLEEEKKEAENKRKASQNKSRSISKPAKNKISGGVNRMKKSINNSKEVIERKDNGASPTNTKGLGDKSKDQKMSLGDKSIDQKATLGDVKAPPGGGKGTFETEVHL